MAETTVDQMYAAAIEAVEHVAMANYQEREEASLAWLSRIRKGENDMTINEVSQAIEDAREAERERERGEKQTALDKELKRHREAVKKIKIGS